MSNSKASAIPAMPDIPANRILSDLALDAAIELERFQSRGQGNLESVRHLASALSERGLKDLALVPVYDRALAVGGDRSSSRNDLFSRLENITQKLEAASEGDLNLLKDFCVALHDALLTSRLQGSRPQVVGQRRFA